MRAAYAELQLARIRLVQGATEEAEQLCRQALTRIRRRETPGLRQKAWSLLGDVLQQKGEYAQASRCYCRAISYLEDLRSHIRVDEYRCTFLKDKLKVYEDLIALCLQRRSSKKIAEAFTYVEAAKARGLAEWLATERHIPSKRRTPASEKLHQQWNRTREELNWLYTRLQHVQADPMLRRASLWKELWQEVARRERSLKRLSHRLQVEDAEYATLHLTPRVLASQVQQALREDEAFLEYFSIRGRIGAFLLTREQMRVFPELADMEQLAPQIRRLRSSLRRLASSERFVQAHVKGLAAIAQHYLRELHRALMAPLDPFIEERNVIIAPCDLLHYVPFHALHTGDLYLIERQEVSYCPSASVYLLCREKARAGQRDGPALLVGLSDPAMPFVCEEITTLASLWEHAYVLTGEQATLEAFIRYAPSCRLIHVASHSLFRRDNPFFSAVQLKDCWLNVYDVFNLTLQAELVTLSACETGMNVIFPGDELFGLMRGFLYAGVPSLLVSLWVISDRSTAELMKEFYMGWKRGLTKRAALRRAQLAVKAASEHPYYWAPFLLIGAPT